MKKEIEINNEGLEEFQKAGIVIGNLLMLSWIVLGSISIGFLNRPIALVYMVIALVMVYIVLRKLVCTNCYYYGKWCATGWGKLSSMMFKKGDIENFSTCNGIKIVPFFFGLLILVPLVSIIVSIILGFSPEKVAVLSLLIFTAVYSGGTNRKNACARCKMNLICPGSPMKSK